MNVLWHSTGFPSSLSVFFVSLVRLHVRVTMLDKNKAVSELCSSLCERRLERTILRPAPLPAETAQFPQFICRHHVGIISRRHTELTPPPKKKLRDLLGNL